MRNSIAVRHSWTRPATMAITISLTVCIMDSVNTLDEAGKNALRALVSK